MMSGGNIHYEMSGKAEAITCGGIGAFHHLVRRVGLVKEIDRHLHLLKVHLPYHESDHVLNIAYDALVGGQRLEDIELRRQDATFLNALGAQRLPDPTTAEPCENRHHRCLKGVGRAGTGGAALATIPGSGRTAASAVQ